VVQNRTWVVVVMCGAEQNMGCSGNVWCRTEHGLSVEKTNMTFEGKILRKIFGPVLLGNE